MSVVRYLKRIPCCCLWAAALAESKQTYLHVCVRGQQFAQQIQQQNPELIEQLRNHIRSRSFSGSAEEHSWSTQVVTDSNPKPTLWNTCTHSNTLSFYSSLTSFPRKGNHKERLQSLHPFLKVRSPAELERRDEDGVEGTLLRVEGLEAGPWAEGTHTFRTKHTANTPSH